MYLVPEPFTLIPMDLIVTWFTWLSNRKWACLYSSFHLLAGKSNHSNTWASNVRWILAIVESLNNGSSPFLEVSYTWGSSGKVVVSPEQSSKQYPISHLQEEIPLITWQLPCPEQLLFGQTTEKLNSLIGNYLANNPVLSTLHQVSDHSLLIVPSLQRHAPTTHSPCPKFA